jgi:nicotinate dehydrogenase subunit A
MEYRKNMTRTIELNVNGKQRRVNLDPDTPLLYVLRNDLDLKGAKYGCGLEQCGACKVLVDGEALPSCKLPVAEVVGRQVVTVEGLGTKDALHPVQRAFVAEGAAQCGYCTAGLVVGAVALLAANSAPTDAEIGATLERHLCRCGVHGRVFKAVRRAAAEMRP